MMEYACRGAGATPTVALTSTAGSLTTVNGGETIATNDTLTASTSRSPERLASSAINGHGEGSEAPSNDLLLALALLQGDSTSLDNRTGGDMSALQRLLLTQLSTGRSSLSNKVMKPEPLWSSIGVAANDTPHIKPLLSFLDPVTIALNGAQPKGTLHRAGHGRRGRPLGSVGRRKLLENNQEALKTELRCELTKPASPERDARIEMIRHKIQENEMRLRRLNETKSSMSRGASVGEKRDRGAGNSCTVNIAPKPKEVTRAGALLQNYPAVVESPCKQQKLEEKKIEPMINLVLSSAYSVSPSSTSGLMTSSSTSSPSHLPDSGVSMIPRLSLANLSPSTPPGSLHVTPVMMSTPHNSSFTSPPSSTFLPPASNLLTPSSGLLAPLATSLTSNPPFSGTPSLGGNPLLPPPLLQPTLNYNMGQRAILQQIVSSITGQSRAAQPPLTRPLDTALTLLNRQKLMECQPSLKCLNCYKEFTPDLYIFPFLCGMCTIRKLILPE